MSLRSSSQQPPVYMSNAIGSRRESNPSRRICHLRAVPLGHFFKGRLFKIFSKTSWSQTFLIEPELQNRQPASKVKHLRKREEFGLRAYVQKGFRRRWSFCFYCVPHHTLINHEKFLPLPNSSLAVSRAPADFSVKIAFLDTSIPLFDLSKIGHRNHIEREEVRQKSFVRLILCVYFGPTSHTFVGYISRKYPTCFARVVWSDLVHNLSDIYVGNI